MYSKFGVFETSYSSPQPAHAGLSFQSIATHKFSPSTQHSGTDIFVVFEARSSYSRKVAKQVKSMVVEKVAQQFKSTNFCVITDILNWRRYAAFTRCLNIPLNNVHMDIHTYVILTASIRLLDFSRSCSHVLHLHNFLT